MPNLPITSPNNVTNDSKVQNFATGFYSNNYPISDNQYDAVRTFFLSRTKGNSVAADALTSSLLTLAATRQLDPIGIIEQFKSYTDNASFTAALLGLLNSERRNTSKLGYSSPPNPDTYVTRNIGS